MTSNEPIENIQWLDAEKLDANDYNPNAVFTPELRLLERSILKTGWVQPVLANRDLIIIDGFHRWMLTRESKKLQQVYKGKCPVAVLDVDRTEAMIMTVRMNRAKGAHIATRMSGIVKELIDERGCEPDELAVEIGATRKEIDLLYQDGVFTQRNISNYKYSKAWIPAESTHDG